MKFCFTSFTSLGKILLKSSKTHKNKFEAGQTDEFVVEAVNIGELMKIKYVNVKFSFCYLCVEFSAFV